MILGLLPLVFFVVAVVLFRRRRQPVLRSLGFSFGRWSAVDAAVGLAIPAIAFTAIFLTERALNAIRVEAGTITWASFVTDVLVQLFFAALLEELIYRVGLLSGVAASLARVPFGRWIAVLVTGALFGIAHLDNEGATWVAALGTGLGGVIYGIAFLATRSIVLPLFLHLSWNMSEGLFGFPISGHLVPGFATSEGVGPVSITGGEYGPEAGIPGLIARFLVIALVLVYVKLRWPQGSIARLEFAPDPARRSDRTAVSAADAG
ncbi:CPBP family intramembrane glutamic endopeptidase [Agromyces aureus]|uniref:ABC transmembrane type-2 domain-containing protein n=1 Tax=Agromyces aureus TaxID=453304 RepID=A0A191WCP6_9MICO|nr:CPBP family intramembrane glutamic endopeptidase [Agromyces aureus]ANJ26007.1 hypothetical protein ATC03_03915 [Agromyces aureus]